MNKENMLKLDIQMMAKAYQPRPADAHKGDMGHALLIAGSKGMAGCAVLAAESCLRSGAGKITVHTPEENRLVLQIRLPEAIVHFGFPPNVRQFQSVGIGPGIGIGRDTGLWLQEILSQGHPMVIDADALTLIAVAGNLPGTGHILTPHLGEMARLAKGFQLPGNSFIEQASFLATHHQCHVILKGHPTHIFCPDGNHYICPRGNAGMATAGSGDVLTGILTGLMAQGYSTQQAALLGTWLHATAGDLAADHLGQEYMLASDITHHLTQAFAEVRKASLHYFEK